MRCDPGSSGIRHGDKRLGWGRWGGGLVRARPCHPWRTGEGLGVLSWEQFGELLEILNRRVTGSDLGLETLLGLQGCTLTVLSGKMSFLLEECTSGLPNTLPPGRVPPLPGHTAQDSRQSGPHTALGAHVSPADYSWVISIRSVQGHVNFYKCVSITSPAHLSVG